MCAYHHRTLDRETEVDVVACLHYADEHLLRAGAIEIQSEGVDTSDSAQAFPSEERRDCRKL